MSQNTIIEKLTQKLGSGDFLRPIALAKAGLFGSVTAVRHALKKGVLPSLRVSPRRVLIPKESVIEHLQKNLSGVSG